jgi:hypothetical protein
MLCTRCVPPSHTPASLVYTTTTTTTTTAIVCTQHHYHHTHLQLALVCCAHATADPCVCKPTPWSSATCAVP